MGFGKGGLFIKKKRLHVSRTRCASQNNNNNNKNTLHTWAGVGSTGSGHQSAGAGEKAQDAGLVTAHTSM